MRQYHIEGFNSFNLKSNGVLGNNWDKENRQWDSAEVLFKIFTCDIQGNVVEKFDTLRKEYEIWCDKFGKEHHFDEKVFLDYYNRGENNGS